MTAKEYYNSTRLVPTNNWTLEMVLNFAEEYSEKIKDNSLKIESFNTFLLKNNYHVSQIDDNKPFELNKLYEKYINNQ